jgi:hypothetical protein
MKQMYTNMLTPIMASFTRSLRISPALNRFSINSVLVDPEQYHAMVIACVALLMLNFGFMILSMGLLKGGSVPLVNYIVHM